MGRTVPKPCEKTLCGQRLEVAKGATPDQMRRCDSTPQTLQFGDVRPVDKTLGQMQIAFDRHELIADMHKLLVALC